MPEADRHANRLPDESPIELVITGLTADGDGLSVSEGQEVRVFAALPGERVVARIVRRKRGYLFATVDSVVEASSDRVTPACAHFGECTGCQWQHVSYTRQLEYKRAIVQREVVKAGLCGDVVMPVLAGEPFGYRNHARFTVWRNGSVGFIHRETRRLARIDACRIMHPWINSALSFLQGRCAGMTQISVRYGAGSGDYLVQPALKDTDIGLISGQKHYVDSLRGRRFRISSPSFFQVNLQQADRLIEVALRYIEPTRAETIVDAYAGVGTFAVCLAPYVRKAIAIEESASSIADARENIAGLANVELVQSKVEHALASFLSRPDAVLIDPPRAGCQREVLEALGRYAPSRLVYVSCDPATMARDLAILGAQGFETAEVQPVDMFPQTHRVECVCLLRRHEPGSRRANPVVLASASPRRRELCGAFGIRFDVERPDIDEAAIVGGPGTPVEKAERLALEKARWVSGRRPGTVVIAADTMVVDGDRILGKPADEDEARAMLRQLRGKRHEVITGIAVVDARGGSSATHCVSRVTMRDYTDGEIEAYVRGGGCFDKAGAYAVQDSGFRPARDVHGCYLNVVGLPLCALAPTLEKAGVAIRARLSGLPSECQACGDRTLA